MPKKPETLFKENRVVPDLKKLKGAFFFKIQLVTLRGIPDIVLVIKGQAIFIEMKKTSSDTLMPLQRRIMEKAKAAGAIVIEANPDNWKSHYSQLVKMTELDS